MSTASPSSSVDFTGARSRTSYDDMIVPHRSLPHFENYLIHAGPTSRDTRQYALSTMPKRKKSTLLDKSEDSSDKDEFDTTAKDLIERQKKQQMRCRGTFSKNGSRANTCFWIKIASTKNEGEKPSFDCNIFSIIIVSNKCFSSTNVKTHLQSKNGKRLDDFIRMEEQNETDEMLKTVMRKARSEQVQSSSKRSFKQYFVPSNSCGNAPSSSGSSVF